MFILITATCYNCEHLCIQQNEGQKWFLCDSDRSILADLMIQRSFYNLP
jgi:hypothetical protein